MQDALQALGVGAGTIFAGVGVGDRRLRPHGHPHQQQQALKCPRCESLNTKFCYYNNYNLSQPRHFCKSCRRYWTKGGVLRNVPVGGGCRKAKRSSTSSANKAKKDHHVAESIQVDRTVPKTTTANKSSSSNTTETSSPSAHDVAGLLAGAQDQPIEGFTGMTMTSAPEDIMGFNDHMNPSTSSSYGNEFNIKAVDYGDSTLFDLTAAVDPNYWNDQPTSLNFLS